jgi:hypothetical protein
LANVFAKMWLLVSALERPNAFVVWKAVAIAVPSVVQDDCDFSWRRAKGAADLLEVEC